MAQPLDLPRGPLRLFSFNVDDAAKPMHGLASLGTDAIVTDGILQVLNNGVYIGDLNGQTFLLEAGQSMTFDYLAVNELWVKNKTPGSAGAVRVLAFVGARRM